MSRLSSSYPLPLPLFIEHPENDYLNSNKTDESDKDTQNSSNSGRVVGFFVFCLEEEGTDDISSCTCCIEEGHYKISVCLTRGEAVNVLMTDFLV
jgi:hypothetical protein